MNKIDNLEKIIDYVKQAYQSLEDAEYNLEEGVISEELESNLLEVQEEVDNLLDSLERRMKKLEDEFKKDDLKDEN